MKKSGIFTKILVISLLSVIVLTGCNRRKSSSKINETFVNDPDMIERTYDVGSFNGIEAESIVEVILSRGNDCSIKVRSSKAFLERLRINNEDGKLHIYMKGAGLSKIRNTKCLVYLTMPELREIELEGVASLKGLKGSTRFESAMPISIRTEGAAKISNLFIKSPNVKIESEGASKIFDLILHTSDFVDISAEGASSINLSMYGGKANVLSEGISKIYLRGRMNQTEIKAEGASEVSAKDLRTIFTSVHSEGVSKIDSK